MSVFFVQHGGYDTHANFQTAFDRLMPELDGGFGGFVDEMKSQCRWEDVTVVMVSEFARTLTEHTIFGTDHA